MDIKDGMNMILKAQRKAQEDRLHDLYCAHFPNMTKDNFLTFEQFVDKFTLKPKLAQTTKIENRQTAEEVLAEANKIRSGKKMHMEGGNN